MTVLFNNSIETWVRKITTSKAINSAMCHSFLSYHYLHYQQTKKTEYKGMYHSVMIIIKRDKDQHEEELSL